MGRPPEGCPPSPAHQPPTDIIVDRDQVPGGRRGTHDPAEFGRERRRNSLVGIDLEDPVAAAGVDPGVAARPFPLPGAFDEPLGKTESDIARPVAAPVEHDDDLVGKAERSEAVGELAFLIADHDESGKGCRLGSTHAAALATERHRRRAAASAASTERPSISVSVVR